MTVKNVDAGRIREGSSPKEDLCRCVSRYIRGCRGGRSGRIRTAGVKVGGRQEEDLPKLRRSWKGLIPEDSTLQRKGGNRGVSWAKYVIHRGRGGEALDMHSWRDLVWGLIYFFKKNGSRSLDRKEGKDSLSRVSGIINSRQGSTGNIEDSLCILLHTE